MSEWQIHSDIFLFVSIQKVKLAVKRCQSSVGTKFDRHYRIKINDLLTKNSKNMASVNIKPLGDRVLVEPAQAETKTAAGIIIPDTAKEKPQRGKVIAVGAGKKDEPMTVKEGDMVLYGKYSGTEINVDGVEYLIMRESDIYAVI